MAIRPTRRRVQRSSRSSHQQRTSRSRSALSSRSSARRHASTTGSRSSASDPRSNQNGDSAAEYASAASQDARSTAQHSRFHEDDVDLETLDEIVMAVDMRDRGIVGCSYFVAREEKLYFMEDVKYGNSDIVNMLRLYINPTVVIVSSRTDEKVLDAMNPQNSRATVSESDPYNLPYQLELRPSNEFSYDAAKSKIAILPLTSGDNPPLHFSIPGDFTQRDGERDLNGYPSDGMQAQLLRISAWISLDSTLTVGCAGAVLSYLQRKRATRYLPGDAAARNYLRVLKLEMFTMRGTMFLSGETLHSLQIIQSESHPHSHNQGPTKSTSGSKEGLSVYGLFHHLARTPQGKYLLRQYFIRPSTSLSVINSRLDTIGVFLRTENAVTFGNLVKHIKGVVNIRGLLINLRKGVSCASGKTVGIVRSIWSGLRRFTFHAICVRRELESLAGLDRLAIYGKVRDTFDIFTLNVVGQLVSDVIDFEQSDEQYRTVVNRNVDEDLDEHKRFYNGMESLLSEVAKAISETVPLDVGLNVIFFPQIGHLIRLPLETETGRAVWEGTEADPWEKTFSSEDQVYYKNNDMKELDQRFGDVWGAICDREIEIVHDLAQKVLEYEEQLSVISDVIGELDCLLALAQGARQYNYSRPRMTLLNVARIKQGRHPLHELSVSSYVPNDTLIQGGGADPHDFQQISLNNDDQSSSQMESGCEDAPTMIMMTGPNYSGKSVYLKQVALITHLAHVGSFVPAESADIGITDKILTRISTRESVSKAPSAFMIDLQQVNLALSEATSRSLVLIDEFGTGTNSADGAGLCCGVFEHLLARADSSPKVLGATHFHEIFESGFLPSRRGLEFAHMEVRLNEEAAEVENQVIHLYNVRKGRSVQSFGTCCAALNGIAHEVVCRAEQLVQLSMAGEDLVAACAVMPREEAKELAESENIARKFIANDIEGDPCQFLNAVLGNLEV